ncbi:MAG TPA: hypothetical protein DCZ10_19010 [Pelotomaculum sp.]|nr:hypothetical protein [Pelotomaculum sp.]
MIELAPYQEALKNNVSNKTAAHYQVWLEKAAQFRAQDAAAIKVLKAEDQPWELSPQGLLRHLINEQLGMREYAVNMYIQEIAPGGRSGKHYHASEEMVFILEGEGYDLHWDPDPIISDKYYWQWKPQELRLPWKAGYFVYIPPLVQHQHFNASSTNKCRILSSTCRTLKDLGYDWLTQVENAPEFDVLMGRK